MSAAQQRREARSERRARNAGGFFDLAESAFRRLGLDGAAANLRRYRSGAGGTRWYADEEIAEHLPVTEAEDTNRSWFEKGTFTGNTRKDDVKEALFGVRDGETRTFEDHWNRGFEYLGAVAKRPLASAGSGFGLDTYQSFGRGEVKSNGLFSVTRRGNNLKITGEVGHGFDSNDNDNLFDFNEGQPGHRQGRILEELGEAAPFRMQYDRRQSVTADVRREADGSLTVRSVRWGLVR
jgi:hypothetical protein